MDYPQSDRGFVPEVNPEGALQMTYGPNPRDQIVRGRRVVGRNEVCPFCQSGIKFKKCHGKPAPVPFVHGVAAGHPNEHPATFVYTGQPSLDSAPWKYKV